MEYRYKIIPMSEVRDDQPMFGLANNDANNRRWVDSWCGAPSQELLAPSDSAWPRIRREMPFAGVLDTGEPVVDQKVSRAAADGKAPLELLPPVAVEGTADVFGYGAVKYELDNWKNAIDDPTARKRYAAAVMRHALGILRGEVLDPESGLPHWDHISTGAMIGRELDPETRGRRFRAKEPVK